MLWKPKVDIPWTTIGKRSPKRTRERVKEWCHLHGEVLQFYMQMTHSLSFVWWSSTYKWCCMVKMYMQMILSYLVLICMVKVYDYSLVKVYMWRCTCKWYTLSVHGEGCMVKVYVQMVLSYLHGEGVHANGTLLSYLHGEGVRCKVYMQMIPYLKRI